MCEWGQERRTTISTSDRRLEGTVSAADDDGVTFTSADGTQRTLRYEEIERARTVFVWGPSDRKAGKA